MAKIPFDIKWKPQIESGEYKVVTESDEPARIICWDSAINKERPIIAIVFDDQIEQYKADGRYDNDYDTSNYDLFIVTPEPELSEFEKGCIRLYQDGRDDGFAGDNLSDEAIKESAAELLELARKELRDEIEFRGEEYQTGYKDGKAEALKDLPRWIPNKFDKHNFETCKAYLDTPRYLCYQDKMIDVSELVEKLPGFKENNHE